VKEQNKSTYRGLAIMWSVFGCVFAVYGLSGKGDALATSLAFLASALFFITSWINWRNYRKF
jgi:hypothetical protein